MGDPVGLLQDELVKLGDAFVQTFEESRTLHAPEAPPPPPDGTVNIHEYYANYWTQRRIRKPFATRGFEHHEESSLLNESKLKEKSDGIMEIVAEIQKLTEQEVIGHLTVSEQEQFEMLENLEKENLSAGEKLKQSISNANVFLQKVAVLQRKVAAGALEFSRE